MDKIKFLVNIDLAGTGEDGIKVVNGKVHVSEFDLLKRLNKENELLIDVKSRGEACNSDHCIFHEAGVPAFYIYTLGGISAYHDVYDKAETLPMSEFRDYARLMVLFLNTCSSYEGQ